MALDNASTPNDYATHAMPIRMDENGFVLIPALDTEVENINHSHNNIDVLAQTSTQEYPLGSLLIRGYEKWRYCKAGSTGLNISAPVQMPKAVHAEQDDDIVVAAAAAIGAKAVWLTSTANLDGAPNNVANSFAGGFLIVNDVTGQGQCLMIKSNAAFSTTEDSEFELYDALTIALTTSSQVGLIKNPYNGVIATEAPVSGLCVGVPQLAVTASYYFWCKTGGPAAVVAQAAAALGSHVVIGEVAAKVNTMGNDNDGLILGVPMTPGVADTEQFIVFLTLD